LNPYDADLKFDETQPERRVAHLQRSTASEVPAVSIHPKGIGVLHSDLRHLTRPPSVNRTANLEIDTPDQQYLQYLQSSQLPMPLALWQSLLPHLCTAFEPLGNSWRGEPFGAPGNPV